MAATQYRVWKRRIDRRRVGKWKLVLSKSGEPVTFQMEATALDWLKQWCNRKIAHEYVVIPIGEEPME